MSILLHTTIGSLIIDLDLIGSPHLCKNILKLSKCCYFNSTLLYHVNSGRYGQFGDPCGNGTGGSSIYGLLDSSEVKSSKKRFIRSEGRILTRDELRQRGRVVMTEYNDVRHTIGSQFCITLESGKGRALDGLNRDFLSLGLVVEDDECVLTQINSLYCDATGRPMADVRIINIYVLDDPYEDDYWMESLLSMREITLMSVDDLPPHHSQCAKWLVKSFPVMERPKEELVEVRISLKDAVKKFSYQEEKQREDEKKRKDDTHHAILLEMLGDIPSAVEKPPKNILFVCKLNSYTTSEDLTLIFQRFDPQAKAVVICDSETGESLQYAFVEFTTERQCNEAYFKMNNVLIDDRRIHVDFSQSVSKEWNKYTQRKKMRRYSNYKRCDKTENT